MSQCISYQWVITRQCEAETKRCWVVSTWAITRDPVQFCPEAGNEKHENAGAREMEQRVQRNMYRSSKATESRSAAAGKTCCSCGGSRSRCCKGDRDARCSESRLEETRYEARSREVWMYRLVSSMHTQEACTTRRLLTTTDAEIALARERRKTITDKVSECRHEQSQRLKSRVQKPERRWMDVSEPTVRVDAPPVHPAPLVSRGWILRLRQRVLPAKLIR